MKMEKGKEGREEGRERGKREGGRKKEGRKGTTQHAHCGSTHVQYQTKKAQEELEFQASLGYIWRPCLKKTKQHNKED
jgi:hypothetical protein